MALLLEKVAPAESTRDTGILLFHAHPKHRYTPGGLLLHTSGSFMDTLPLSEISQALPIERILDLPVERVIFVPPVGADTNISCSPRPVQLIGSVLLG